MEIYFLVLGLIVALGFGVEICRESHLEGKLLLGKREYKVSVAFCFWCLIFTIFLLFGGLRYNVGTDFESYCEIFTNICKDWDDVLYGGTERGFVWLNRIVSLYTTDPQWIIFITNAIICVFGLTCICKFSLFTPISLYIFYTTIYYQGFNLIRQGIACAIVLLAFGYARQRKSAPTANQFCSAGKAPNGRNRSQINRHNFRVERGSCRIERGKQKVDIKNQIRGRKSGRNE